MVLLSPQQMKQAPLPSPDSDSSSEDSSLETTSSFCTSCSEVDDEAKYSSPVAAGQLHSSKEEVFCRLCNTLIEACRSPSSRSSSPRHSPQDTVGVNNVIVYSVNGSPSNGSAAAGALTSREVRIVPEAQINMTLVRSWTEQCDESQLHGCCGIASETKWPKNFKLMVIDVRRQCITRVDPTQVGLRYFALSYVWGRVSQLALTTNNIATLTEDQSLSRLSDALPQVIKDAMTVVYELGERYLWVDSLSITQDDATAKHDLITRMSEIYANAYLTICALAGVNASAGLPGVRPYTRVLDTIGNSAGFRVARRPPRLSKLIFRSHYNKRGWTFQERLLSRRCLFFANQQVYFQCKFNIWCEDRNESLNAASGSIGGYVLEDLKLLSPLPTLSDFSTFTSYREIFPTYSRIITEYTSKSLSFTHDILNAITGILESLKSLTGWQFVCGLPAPILSLSLLWVPAGKALRRYVAETDKSTTRVSHDFPSWSWIGWEGIVDYEILPTHEHKGKLRSHIILIAAEIAGVSTEVDQVIGHVRGLSRPQGGFSQGPSSRLNVLHIWGSVAAASEFSYDTFFTSHTPLRKSAFKTVAQPIVTIQDRDNRYCGVIYGVDRADISAWRLKKCELILLSETQHIPQLQSTDGASKAPIFSAQHFNQDGFCICNVMLVESTDGYSERLALGQMHVSAWRGCKSTLKYIHLA